MADILSGDGKQLTNLKTTGGDPREVEYLPGEGDLKMMPYWSLVNLPMIYYDKDRQKTIGRP